MVGAFKACNRCRTNDDDTCIIHTHLKQCRISYWSIKPQSFSCINIMYTSVKIKIFQIMC
jgi:hypothetical protein